VDVEDAEHERFVGHGVEAVELRRALRDRIRLVEAVGVAPVDRVGERALGEEERAFGVVAAAAARAVAFDAVDPEVAEGVEEEGAVVARAAGGDGGGER
jgi:hypothetical protein